jgi:hypothetical protein
MHGCNFKITKTIYKIAFPALEKQKKTDWGQKNGSGGHLVNRRYLMFIDSSHFEVWERAMECTDNN